MSSIQLDTLLRFLGVSKEDEREVRRILDGTIPRVDFVNLGANGYGEDGFLVKKGRKMLGTMKTVNGKVVFVAKGEDNPEDEKPGIKMSGATKEGLAAQIAALQKVHDEAEEDDSVEGIPEAVLQILGVTKEAEPEDKQEAKPEKDPEPASESTMDVPIGLEGLVKGLTDAAGASAETDEFKTLMGQLFGLLAPEQQALAEVSKSFKGELAARDNKIAQLEAAVKALVQGVGASGLSFRIPDGTDTKPSAETKPDNPFAAAAGMNLSGIGDDPKRRYKLPQ